MTAPTVQDSLSALEQERCTAASRTIASQVMMIHDLLRAMDKLRSECESAASTMLGYEPTPENARSAEQAAARFRHTLAQLTGTTTASINGHTLVTSGHLASAAPNLR